MKVWRFRVGYSKSKDELMAGNVVQDVIGVTVKAESPLEARLLAEQMVATLGFEPTEVEEVS